MAGVMAGGCGLSNRRSLSKVWRNLPLILIGSPMPLILIHGIGCTPPLAKFFLKLALAVVSIWRRAPMKAPIAGLSGLSLS